MTNPINLSKLNTYVVQQEGEKISLTKLNTYVLEQPDAAPIYQDIDADRPVYRDAPSGGVPYVDMSATGASLKISVTTTGTHTFIVYKADQTFDVFEGELITGANTLPVTDDFNQIVVLFGGNLHRFTIDAVKEGMKARI